MQCFPDTQGKFLNNSSKIFSKLKLKPQKLNKPEILVTSNAAKTAKKKPELYAPAPALHGSVFLLKIVLTINNNHG